jgi:hypothetical protein
VNRLKAAITRHPIISYVVLCYAITWPVWFSIPLIAGKEWTLIRIFVGIGLGPGLAAVILDYVRGGAPVCGFIFASAAASRSRALNSITAWRVPLRWWLIALFLPAALLGVSLLIALMSGEKTQSVTAGLPASMWILFTWLWNRTAGNLLLVIALHTAINNSQRIVPTTTLFPILLVALIVCMIVKDRMWRHA